MKKKLGVIGGLGPLATAYFYELVTEFTAIQSEQEHLEILLYSRPSIPDRTAYILDRGKPSPLPGIITAGKDLCAIGAEVIAIPCVTAHYFFEAYQKEISAEVIHMPRETAAVLQAAGIKVAGIMATDGTVRTGVLSDALTERGIAAVTPGEKGQATVMSLIYDCIKAGKPITRPVMEQFFAVSAELREKGAEVIILGCTELSLFKRMDIGQGYIDVLEVLAKRSIEKCGGTVWDKYENLLCQR